MRDATVRKASAAEVASLIDDAYDLIDTEGWARKIGCPNGVPTEGPFDVAQALARAAITRKLGRAFLPAVRAIERHVGDALVLWNDRQTSARVVLVTLEAVADLLRCSGDPNRRMR